MKIYPSDISARLELVKSSLKELEIIALDGTTFDHDGTSLDLSTFDMLQKISISSILVIQTSEFNQSSAGLYQLLPISINELKVEFLFVKKLLLVLC